MRPQDYPITLYSPQILDSALSAVECNDGHHFCCITLLTMVTYMLLVRLCVCVRACYAGERSISRTAQHLAGASGLRATEAAGLRAGEHAAERVAERVAVHAGDSMMTHAGEAAAAAAVGHAVGRRGGVAGLLDGLLDKLLSSRLMQRVASPAVSAVGGG